MVAATLPRTALTVCLTLLLSCAATYASEIHLFVASCSYIVTVAPVDKESRDAENSMLYQQDIPGSPWRSIGLCRKQIMENGDVRFHREVTVEKDGVYYYTSRPVVGGKVTSEPQPESPRQAIVVVDTSPPAVEIVRPGESVSVDPGEPVELSWTADDENLADKPTALAFSTDGGKSWNIIGRELSGKGDMAWAAPDDLESPAILRFTAVDKAGNIGRALRRIGLDIPKPPIASPDLPPLARTPAPEPEKQEETVKQTAMIKKPEEKQTRIVECGDPGRSWLYYLMAINQMKQNKPADALQYYWLSVKEDPGFIEAWADIGLAYIDLGAYKTARDVITDTRQLAPDRIDLMHLMGETCHAEGMALLGKARNADERRFAKDLIDQAVEWYGRALEKAAEDWCLADQAASFYRLGEICYYVNMDRVGARAYWQKILELHSTTPNPDLVKWSTPEDKDKARERLHLQTYQRVSLEAWQNWARGYLEQLDARERAGILDLMPARQLSASDMTGPLAYGNNPMNPGRDDGRSLFSLPAQYGNSAPVAASLGLSGKNVPARKGSAPVYSFTAADAYSFYAPKAGHKNAAIIPPKSQSIQPDSYYNPAGAAVNTGWNQNGIYGNKPVADW